MTGKSIDNKVQEGKEIKDQKTYSGYGLLLSFGPSLVYLPGCSPFNPTVPMPRSGEDFGKPLKYKTEISTVCETEEGIYIGLDEKGVPELNSIGNVHELRSGYSENFYWTTNYKKIAPSISSVFQNNDGEILVAGKSGGLLKDLDGNSFGEDINSISEILSFDKEKNNLLCVPADARNAYVVNYNIENKSMEKLFSFPCIFSNESKAKLLKDGNVLHNMDRNIINDQTLGLNGEPIKNIEKYCAVQRPYTKLDVDYEDSNLIGAIFGDNEKTYHLKIDKDKKEIIEPSELLTSGADHYGPTSMRPYGERSPSIDRSTASIIKYKNNHEWLMENTQPAKLSL